MAIELVCEECGSVLRAPDGAAGRVGRCRECGREIRVPTPEDRIQLGDHLVDAIEPGLQVRWR